MYTLEVDGNVVSLNSIIECLNDTMAIVNEHMTKHNKPQVKAFSAKP